MAAISIECRRKRRAEIRAQTLAEPISMAEALERHRLEMRRAVPTVTARWAAMAFGRFGE